MGVSFAHADKNPSILPSAEQLSGRLILCNHNKAQISKSRNMYVPLNGREVILGEISNHQAGIPSRFMRQRLQREMKNQLFHWTVIQRIQKPTKTPTDYFKQSRRPTQVETHVKVCLPSCRYRWRLILNIPSVVPFILIFLFSSFQRLCIFLSTFNKTYA